MSNVAETATVAWAYTMADIDRLAWAACRRHVASRLLDTEERHYTAWHGVVELLCTVTAAPEWFDLLNAGLRALDYAAVEERHHHGARPWDGSPERHYRDGDNLPSGGRRNEAPNFTKYWRPLKHDRTDGFTDHLVENLALPAALRVLTDEQYEAIVTLAVFDNNVGAAAASLGMKYHGFYYRVQSARRAIKAVWFDDETPVETRNRVDACRVGHDRASYGVRKPNGSWECRQCTRNAARRRAAAA